MSAASHLAPVASLLAPVSPALAALALAVAADLSVGEPPRRLHPVAWFGSLVDRTDREWSRPRLVGVAVAVALPLAAAVALGVLVAVAAGVGPRAAGVPLVAVAVAAGVLFAAASLRMLLDVTSEVVALTETDPAAARESVRALVGRDPTALSSADLRSAAVESATENLADGFVAPLWWFAVGATVGAFAATAGTATATSLALPLGVAGAVWVKGVNTLDSMLGYRSKPVGWASARLDDLAMYLPARASAACLAVAALAVHGGSPTGVLRRARPWAREPTSPNSGWPMATGAAALGVRLEKPGSYALNSGVDLPTAADAERAVRLVGAAGGVAVVVAAGWLLALAGVIAWL
ncbi:CobD/CbiB family cobalamin biosynthesis protein [Halorubrum pallidum]